MDHEKAFERAMDTLVACKINPNKHAIKSVIKYMYHNYGFRDNVIKYYFDPLKKDNISKEDWLIILNNMADATILILLAQYLLGISDAKLYDAVSINLAKYMSNYPDATCDDFESDSAMSISAGIIDYFKSKS